MSKLTRFRRIAKTVRWAERVIGWAGIEGDAETWKGAIKRWWRPAGEVLVPALSGLGGRVMGNDPWWAPLLLMLAGAILVIRVGVPFVGFVRQRGHQKLRNSAATSRHVVPGGDAFDMILESSLIDPEWPQARKYDTANALFRRFETTCPDAIRPPPSENDPPQMDLRALKDWLNEIVLSEVGLDAHIPKGRQK